jgi:hypothetical protein
MCSLCSKLEAAMSPRIHTTRNPLIYDEILMTFFDFITDHTASMTNSQILSWIRNTVYEARYEVQTL